MLLIILYTFVGILVLPALTLASEFECQDSGDCPKYNYCQVAWCGGQPCSGRCYSNFAAAIAEDVDCSEQEDPDLYCRQQEVAELEIDDLFGMDETTATARCTQLPNGTSGCRKAFFTPCAQDSECPTSFTCQEKEFSDGRENVCVPHYPFNNGEAVHVRSSVTATTRAILVFRDGRCVTVDTARGFLIGNVGIVSS